MYDQQDGSTPLMVASSGGHTETVLLLIENGAGPNAKNAVRSQKDCNYMSAVSLSPFLL